MAPSSTPQITSVHLVGSIPLSSTEEVFRSATTSLPNRLKRIPDGETGERRYFTGWFLNNPIYQRQPVLNHEFFHPDAPTSFTDAEADEIFANLGELETGYDKAALESYQVFKRLRAEGVIPQGVRFMVALPSPVALVALFFREAFLTRAERVLVAHIQEVVRKIQRGVPAEDLSIQWDVPIEFALLEGAEAIGPGHVMRAWFEPLFDGIVERLVSVGESVDRHVEMGYHFCYGDVRGTHFVQPKDTGLMADVGEGLLRKIQRRVAFIHLPVPKSRTDRAYYEPLRKLAAAAKDGSTEIILGVVHECDLEGTQERIRAASEILDAFGVGTECGMGRRDRELLETSWEVSRAVSGPIVSQI